MLIYCNIQLEIYSQGTLHTKCLTDPAEIIVRTNGRWPLTVPGVLAMFLAALFVLSVTSTLAGVTAFRLRDDTVFVSDVGRGTLAGVVAFRVFDDVEFVSDVAWYTPAGFSVAGMLGSIGN